MSYYFSTTVKAKLDEAQPPHWPPSRPTVEDEPHGRQQTTDTRRAGESR